MTTALDVIRRFAPDSPLQNGLLEMQATVKRYMPISEEEGCGERANSLGWQATQFRSDGRLDLALTNFDEAIKVLHGYSELNSSPDLIFLLMGLQMERGLTLSMISTFASDERQRPSSAYREAIAWARRLPPDQLATSQRLNWLAEKLREVGELDVSREFAAEAIRIARITASDQPLLCSCLLSLARTLLELKLPETARPLAEEALDLSREYPELGENFLVETVRALGRCHAESHDVWQAIQVYDQVLSGNPSLSDRARLHVLIDLARTQESLCNLTAASKGYGEIVSMCRRMDQRKSFQYVDGLEGLSRVERKRGNYSVAAPLLQETVEAREAICNHIMGEFVGPGDQFVWGGGGSGYLLTMPAKAVSKSGFKRSDLNEAMRSCVRSMTEWAMQCWAIGDVEKAESLLRHAVTYFYPPSVAPLFPLKTGQVATSIAANLPPSDPSHAPLINALAALYVALDRPAVAIDLLLEANVHLRNAGLTQKQRNDVELVYNTNRSPEWKLQFSGVQVGLARAAMAAGDYETAARKMDTAVAERRAAVGEQHPEFAAVLHEQARLFMGQGRWSEAEPLIHQALEIYRQVFSDRHPDTAACLSSLVSIQAATGRVSEALNDASTLAAVQDELIGQVFAVGTENQRAAFLRTLQDDFDRFLTLVLALDSPADAVRAALDLVLRRKGLRAEAAATQRDAVLSGKYPQLQKSLRELSLLRMQLARETLGGPQDTPPEEHRRKLADLRSRTEQLEVELARQIPEMQLKQSMHKTDHGAVARALPAGSILIEFVRFRPVSFAAILAEKQAPTGPARYLAFVLAAGTGDELQLCDLGEAPPIDVQVERFRASVSGEGILDRNAALRPAPGRPDGLLTALYRGLSSFFLGQRSNPSQPRDLVKRTRPTPAFEAADHRSLTTQLLGPLADRLQQVSHVLIAPDGALHRLPFALLPDASGGLLIDRLEISYVNTGRDLLRFAAKGAGERSKPMIVADPDFDLSSKGSKSGLVFGSRQSRDLQMSELAFGRLPGTRVEGERIRQLVKGEWLSGATALEGRLKARCRSPNILHLATHGYFLEDQVESAGQSSATTNILDESQAFSRRAMESPLLRSGLALAGANSQLRRKPLPEEAEDGLLTAEDVGGLDLLGTELVVLSACNTALGEVQVSEGVFGLQRAFVLAGVQTLVMSLWSVPDEQTCALMEDFYRRITAGESCVSALRAAQLALRQTHPQPWYWGAFICQGNPRPLGRGSTG